MIWGKEISFHKLDHEAMPFGGRRCHVYGNIASQYSLPFTSNFSSPRKRPTMSYRDNLEVFPTKVGRCGFMVVVERVIHTPESGGLKGNLP